MLLKLLNIPLIWSWHVILCCNVYLTKGLLVVHLSIYDLISHAFNPYFKHTISLLDKCTYCCHSFGHHCALNVDTRGPQSVTGECWGLSLGGCFFSSKFLIRARRPKKFRSLVGMPTDWGETLEKWCFKGSQLMNFAHRLYCKNGCFHGIIFHASSIFDIFCCF